MELNNDELSLLYIMSLSYVETLKEKIASTSKKKADYNRLISLRNSAVALSGKLLAHLESLGFSFKSEE